MISKAAVRVILSTTTDQPGPYAFYTIIYHQSMTACLEMNGCHYHRMQNTKIAAMHI